MSRKRRVSNIWHSVPKPKQRLGRDSAPLGKRGGASYGRRSTIITSQIPVDKWHDVIGDPTYADAILDRLVRNATRIDLAGESLRRTRPRQTLKG